jgi:DNA polymerase-3 subunit delta
MTDLIGGQVKVGFPGIALAMPHLKSGKLRALGVSSSKRSPELPEVPTLSEAGVPGYDATQWLGFAGPKGLPEPIVKRLGNQKLNKNASEMLQQYLVNPAPDNVLLITADKLDAGAKKSAWLKAVDKSGVIVELWPVEPAQLPEWIRRRAVQMDMRLDDSAVEVLCQRVEGNLLAARQEMSKLQLLFPNKTLSADDVIDAVSDSSRFDIFGLTDAALGAQPQRVTRIIQVLRQEGTEAAVVLWAVAREIRTLHTVQRGLQQGTAFDSLCQQQRLFGKRKQLVRSATKRLSPATLENLLQQAAEVDRLVKGARAGDPWLTLTAILLHLAGITLPLDATG